MTFRLWPLTTMKTKIISGSYERTSVRKNVLDLALQSVVAAGIILIVGLACMPLSSPLGYRSISLILLTVVSLLPLRFDVGPVLLASVVAALTWNFLFIPPLFTFAIGGIDDIFMWGVFLVVATVSGVLTGRIRAREQRAAALFALTKDLSSAHSQHEVIAAGVTHIGASFSTDVVVFLGEPDGDIPPGPHEVSTWRPDAEESKVAAWAYWNERKAGRTTEHHPEAQGLFLPMSGPRFPLGVIGVRTRTNGSAAIPEVPLLENFVAQVGLACERELLNDISKQNVVIAESERLYRTLFSSISHEFRTPLAAILGSAENLLNTLRSSGDSPGMPHAEEIQIAAKRLDRLVANLLDMSRLESGLLRPKRDWTDLRDVVSSALHDLESDLQERRITTDLPENLPLLRLDFGLFQQALVNILHNALVHTPRTSAVSVTGRTASDRCIIEIADEGMGIPAPELQKIFDKFYRSTTTTAPGTGLGLPIARGFVEAQGGTLTVRNRVGGGAEFIITLPLTSSAAVA